MIGNDLKQNAEMLRTFDGTTALVAFLIDSGDSVYELYVGHLGDCRLLLGLRDKSFFAMTK